MALLSLESILNVIYLGSFVVFFVYGQRIQTSLILFNVRRNLGRLETFRNTARNRLRDTIVQLGANPSEVQDTLERLANSFVITPISLDPAGIVRKFEHVLDNHDDHLKGELSRLVDASEVQINNLTNLLDVSISLENMFRVVRHYYLESKRQGRLLALAQLQMSLPTIMEEAETYNSAVDAFAMGKAIGDGIGPLVARSFSKNGEARELIKEFGPIKRVITVDAALKLEGEPSGEVADGTGAAIGGSGTERYHIEEAVAKSNITLDAVVVKMPSKEAISALTPQLREAADTAYNRVRTIIQIETAPGDTVIVAGVGNTMGID